MKKTRGHGKSMQSAPAVRASISFPPDLYQTLEDIGRFRLRQSRANQTQNHLGTHRAFIHALHPHLASASFLSPFRLFSSAGA